MKLGFLIRNICLFIFYREKCESNLFKQYKNALNLMSKKEMKKGIKILKTILKSPLLSEKDFVEMKFSIH